MSWEARIEALHAGAIGAEIVSEHEAKARSCRGSFRELRKCFFEEGVSLESPILGASDNILVGAHSYMNDGGYIRAPLIIGRYCSIGRRVSINAGGHRLSAVSTSPIIRGKKSRPYDVEESAVLGIRPRGAKWTQFGHDVWIGDGAVVLPGVKVGTGAVVGANSVVTRDVPPYAIVAGLPAKLLRFRFPDEVIVRLLESRYWEIPLKKLNEFDCANVFEFLETVDACKTEFSKFELFRLG